MKAIIRLTTTQLRGVTGSIVKMIGVMNAIVAPNDDATGFETKFFVIEHPS